MGQVTIDCKSCGREFQSPVQSTDRQAFESLGFTNNSVQCPACGRMNVYNKPDLKFSE